MFNLMLLDLPSLDYFVGNPLDGISQVITSPMGVFGYIFVLFALIAIVYSYNRNAESIGIFVVLYGVVADILYPIEIAIIINLLGIGIIFGGVLWKAMFKARGEY